MPKLVRLLQGDGSMPYDTPQHCVQALINLAGDPANRAAMVQAGAVPVLAGLLRDVSALSEVRPRLQAHALCSPTCSSCALTPPHKLYTPHHCFHLQPNSTRCDPFSSEWQEY